MKRAWFVALMGKIEMHIGLSLGIVLERDHLEDVGVDGIIILK
jgi:hypothetical protein